MTNRRASIEGSLGRYPPEIPTSDTAPVPSESSTASVGTTGTGTTASILRRRPLRAKSTSNASPSSHPPLWVDTDPGDSRKAKGARINARRASGVESPHNSASPQTSASEPDLLSHEKEKDSVGFLPKLSRILEGKESKTLRRQKNSTVSSIDNSTPTRRRRRPAEDVVTRRPIRQKHASLQRRAESLANLTNPSLISVLSGATQQSGASSGSNSTITQKSYDKNHVSKRRLGKERKRPQTKQQKSTAMAPEPPSVFQYMDDGPQHNTDSDGDSDVREGQYPGEALEKASCEAPASVDWSQHDESASEQALTQGSHTTRPSSSSSSASSRDSDSDDGHSSNAEEPSGESPMTSPASTRMSGTAAIASSEARRIDRGTHSKRNRVNSDSSISVRESNPEPDHPEVYVTHHMHVEEPGDEEDENSDSSEEDENDVDGDDEQEASHDQMHRLALERAPPPRLPSTSSSRHSDPHTRRLRNQEQELREHVLQNPQPHRDFRYEGGPSPHAHSAMPLYDVHAYSGASPDNYYDPAAQPPVWPPAPPPPPIDYYSPTYNAPPVPYLPGSEGNYAMAARPPMTTVPQQPFYAQPPHYPQHSAGPDMTKTTVVGYELLADRLAELPKDKDDKSETGETHVIPMYRKFEHLNHRVLLHLQDEIAELEEELRYLDESIAQSSPGAETGNPHPASRRGESRYGGELHYRRTELLGRVYLKLGQYNQALSSFSSMLKNLDPAKVEEIQAYRAWMKEHAPIEAAEARFLERKNDLLAVTRRRSTGAMGVIGVGGVLTHQSAAIGYPLLAVLPLMAFAIVPSLLGRLFIVALIGGAEVMVVTSTELADLLTVREWVICASIYFGVMALLAGVVQ